MNVEVFRNGDKPSISKIIDVIMVSILVVEVSLNPNLKVSIFTRKGNVQVSMNFVSRVIFNFVLKIV